MIYNRFSDIPQLTNSGTYEVSFNLETIWKTLKEWQEESGLDLNPDFQRLHVWTEAQQIAWLEYIMRGGKSGRVIYLNNPDWNKVGRGKGYNDFVLVDGKQRLEAIRRFMANEIKVYGNYRRDYQDKPCMLRQSRILINVNDLPTKAAVLTWYCEMNAGGTPHTAEEIDKAKALLESELKAGVKQNG